jgi:hypothetical protein
MAHSVGEVEVALDRRRGARLNGTFWVWVLGVDTAPRLRRGNISITGARVDAGADCGGPGTVVRLKVARAREDFGAGRAVEVLARVVREEEGAAAAGGVPREGHEFAFEFMMEGPQSRASMEALVRTAVQAQLIGSSDLDVACHLPARIEGWPVEAGAVVRRLGTETMALHVGEELAVARRLRVAVRSPCSLAEVAFDAVVSICRPLGQRGGASAWEATVRYAPRSSPSGGDAGEGLGSVLALLGEALVPSEACQPVPLPDLHGTLGDITLFSLLGFLDMERRSGVLSVEHEHRFGFVYLRDGQVVDVEVAGVAGGPRARLTEMLRWRRGRFSVVLRDVERDDALCVPTMHLLLDLAREQDECDAGVEPVAADDPFA